MSALGSYGSGDRTAKRRAVRTRRANVAPPAPSVEPRAVVIAGYLVEQAQHAIERADAKASTLTATATAVVAIVAQGAHRDAAGAYRNAALVLTGTGSLLWVFGIVTTAFAIFPRLAGRYGSGSALALTGYPRRFDPDALRAQLPTAEAELERLLLEQAHALSRIAVTKYRLIRYGMVFLGAGGVLGLAGLVVH
ncbi:hypothetical protein KGA66_20130 [Actinocrinis puniceicyclus]|uniref:Pycsar effector protein domain-containing protein n=1 Tax=Actinocrinis puniceicyclus TaxID=977794 RepID=A0A8J7WTF5_9ACTN|nr:Pycsar system effector family protein [Actinocrinis puniceicyclus]MBS2965370.1 hypothetical protein [Actinocrinis puniceicyclus]